MASVKEQFALTNDQQIAYLRRLIDDMRLDLSEIRSVLNTHVHGGVSTGAGNSGAPTTTVGPLRTTE